MGHKSLGLVCLLTLLCGRADASLLDGKTVQYDYLFPTDVDIYYQTSFVVGPGAELNVLYGSGGSGTLDVSDTNITVDFYATSGWTAAPFNGFRISDFTNTIDAITSVTVNAITNMVGFSAANVSFDANNIYVNWQGLSFDADTVVSLDINGGTSVVPEPATILVWSGLGLAAVVSLYAKKRKS